LDIIDKEGKSRTKKKGDMKCLSPRKKPQGGGFITASWGEERKNMRKRENGVPYLTTKMSNWKL